ncbi:MAG: tetratricopeptide repeat protein [Alphaproteobacteria bacterium]|nr:tetratricopeptide repeat protein [Alphaproteobacteria bacterium]
MDALPSLADPDALIRRVAVLIDAGRTGAARPLLAAVRRMTAPSPDLSCLSVRLAMREGRPLEALEELDAAVAGSPSEPTLRALRAELRLQMDDPAGAAADAAEAVILDPARPNAKALLGMALLGLGRAADAVACLAEAVRMTPANPFFRQGLAEACEADGDRAGAEEAIEEGIELCPGAVGLRNLAILLRVRRGDFTGAITQAEAAQRDGVVDACVLGLHGHALSSLGRHEDAAVAYREALKLGPDDVYVRHMVASSGALPSGDRAPEPYVRAVFDGYAPRFEAHLVALGYRVPGLIRAALVRHLPTATPDEAPPAVLDLGCGTGLLAAASCDLPLGPWVGVDLSTRMLAEAAAKEFYAELHEADLMAALAAEQRPWPIILAGDVFCYFGALDAPFARVHDRLLPGGLFVFSLEEREPASDGDPGQRAGWRLGRQGRYAHDTHYVETTAHSAGLEIRAIDRETLRREAGAPVPGLLVVLARPR